MIMKRIVFAASAVLSLVAATATAQNDIKRIGIYSDEGRTVVADAASPLDVEITVCCEQIIVGPYARYAQKYLGVRAPLVDRTSYGIVDARILLASDACAAECGAAAGESVRTLSYAGSATEFARVLPNRMSIVEQTPEAAAKQLPEDIFSLRRHRVDLITGEAGENVFGAGLQCALDKIDELEQTYLELFLGKRVETTSTHRVRVVLSEDKTNYVVARFSETAGVLPSDDLSGEMILLQIAPSQMQYPQSNPKGRLTYRYANRAQCSLSLGQQSLCSVVLPLFEFGRTIVVAAPVK